MAEKFVRRHTTDEEAKETLKKIEASRAKSSCKAEKAAMAYYIAICMKYAKKSDKNN